MQAINGNNGQRLAKFLYTNEPLYVQLFKRTKRKRWKQGEAWLIRNYGWPHFLLQRDPADVIYLDESDVIIAVEYNIKPYKLRRRMKQAASILKVPPGTIVRTGTRVGHEIQYIKGSKY